MADLIYDEIELFWVCLLLGMSLALVYDCIRIVRMLFRHWDVFVDMEDLCFWILTAWCVFKTLFHYNEGVLRGYAFVGMFLGVIVYVLTLSRLLMFVVRSMVPYWNRIKNKVGECIKKPVFALGSKCRKALKNIATDVTMAIKGR